MERSNASRPVLTRTGPAGRGPFVGVAVAAILVAVALLKPWPSGTANGHFPSVDPSRNSSASPAWTPEPPIALPAMALDPPATDCYADSGWRVCILGISVGVEIRSWFGSAPGPSAASVGPTIPAVLLITSRGAGLGLYAPLGGKERVAGSAVVSAWQIGEGTGGTRWIALHRVISISLNDEAAGPVYRPPPDGLGSADRWPTGRYVFRLQATKGGWERWFAVEIVSTVPDVEGGRAPFHRSQPAASLSRRPASETIPAAPPGLASSQRQIPR